MTRKTIFLILLIIYLIIIFSVEFAYRNVLYEKSVEYIEKIDQGGFLKYFYFFLDDYLFNRNNCCRIISYIVLLSNKHIFLSCIIFIIISLHYVYI